MIARRSAKIIIVDDHPAMRAGLGKLISDEPDLLVAGEAGSVQEAMRLLANTEPDAAIIDIILPDGSGLDLVKSIHSQAPDIRILVVSMHDESVFAERAVRAGAMGYINKKEAPNTVVKALRQLLKGKLYLSPAMTERLSRSVADGTQPKSMDSPLRNLTKDGREVFELIGHGLGNGEIAEKLHQSIETIETHCANIKKGLNLQSGDELIRRAMQWSLDRQ